MIFSPRGGSYILFIKKNLLTLLNLVQEEKKSFLIPRTGDWSDIVSWKNNSICINYREGGQDRNHGKITLVTWESFTLRREPIGMHTQLACRWEAEIPLPWAHSQVLFEAKGGVRLPHVWE